MSKVPIINIADTQPESKWTILKQKWLKTNPNQIKNLKNESYTPSLATIVAAAYETNRANKEKKNKLNLEVSEPCFSSKFGHHRQPPRPPSRASMASAGSRQSKASKSSKYSIHYSTRPKTAPAPSTKKSLLEKRSPVSPLTVIQNEKHGFSIDYRNLMDRKTKSFTSFEHTHILFQIWQPQLAKSYRASAVPEEIIPMTNSRSRAIANFKIAQKKIIMLKAFLDDCGKSKELDVDKSNELVTA